MTQQVINVLTSYLWRISIKFGLCRLIQWQSLSDISLRILMLSNFCSAALMGQSMLTSLIGW